MKIESVKTYVVEGVKYNWTLVKIETDTGLHRWGEATNWPGTPLIKAACEHSGKFIEGIAIETHSFMNAPTAVEMAIFGDIDGVCVVPASIAHEVLTKALEKARGEKTVKVAIQRGQSAQSAFEEYGIM